MKPTVVALHGFLGQGRDWEDVRTRSRRDLQWICPDLFAAGASFNPPDTEGPCWLAGYSFGARLALRWLQEAPARWHGALLLSVNPGNFQTGEERAARRRSDLAWADAFRSEPWGRVTARWQAQEVLRGPAGPVRDAEDFSRARLADALTDFSVAGQFTDPLLLPPPLIWMAGGRDTKFSALQAAMRQAGFPGVFLLVGQAGHRLLADAPAAVASALDDLVACPPGRGEGRLPSA